ncbi:MAG: NUDIX hydrolase [Oscillospiraceae bacterium]|nr:NUDIX hydrolase [Oscillospiraceae bacterium]
MNKGRCQCIVVRDNKILMVKHVQNNKSWLCLPGGGIEDDENADEGALRELQEECNVLGKIITKTSEVYEWTQGGMLIHVTYLVDIGSQEPTLGYDPEVIGVPILQGVGWYALNEVCERDRVFLWAAGLYQVETFAKELHSWGDDISYPTIRT